MDDRIHNREQAIAMLRGVAKDTKAMLRETAVTKAEIDQLETEVEQNWREQLITRLTYDIDMTRIAKNRERAHSCEVMLKRQLEVARNAIKRLEMGL